MPKTLLLADDSVTIQKVVGISFANEDIVLLTVDNGDDAIARARESRPDIILADVVMPGKNGYDVCQTIKADASLAHIPVLLLTGTFEAFDEQRAQRVGADGHITKPFEAQSLVDQVNTLLSRPAPTAAASAPAAAPTAPAAAAAAAPAAARASRPAPPQPVSHTADTAYDFFDDPAAPTATRDDAAQEATVTFGAPPVAAPVAAPPAPLSFDPPESFEAPAAAAPQSFGSDSLDVDSGEAAGFGGGDSLFDDFDAPGAEAPTATAPARPSPAPAAPRTPASEPMAFGGGSPESSSDQFDWDVRSESEPAATATSEWDAPAPASSDNAIDFEANTQPDPEPPSSAGWDLARDPAPALRPEPSEVPDWFTGPSDPLSASYPADVVREADAPRSAPVARDFEALDAPVGGFDLDASLDEGSAFGDAIIDPQGARDYDVSSSDLGPPIVSATLVEPPAPRPAPAAAPAPPPTASFASAPPPSSAIPERDRREIHDALEKVAWEAFGPVAENLVREAVERIERIAWEVIPQLAEALIKEEIRKLKGD
jgi:CheY-like chemotaxis protein